MKMKASFSDELKLLAIIIAFYLVIRLSLLTYIPFLSDETVYPMMIEEQVAHPTLVPTFLGYEVGWKPPLFFWVYGALTRPLLGLPIPLEAVYRLPTLAFGLLNALMVYMLVKKVSSKSEVAFFTSLIYVFAFLVVFTDTIAMTDTLAMTFILASILAYLAATENQLFFILAGSFSLLAFFTKQVNALVAPLFMIAYLYQFDRKKLLNAFFLSSLLFIPAAFLMNYLAFSSPDQAHTVYFDLIKAKIIENLNVSGVVGSFAGLFLLAGVWFFLSLLGFLKWWQENLAMGLWYALILFPLVAGKWMPFYYLPVMPALAYFSALALLRNERNVITMDRFFWFVLLMVMTVSLITGLYEFHDLRQSDLPKKAAGEFLAFKENVLIIGGFPRMVMPYKTLTESRELGRRLDFGWILGMDPGQNLSPFLADYNAPVNDTINGSFGLMYFEPHTYRKDTNITRFDYIAVVESENLTPNGTLLYNESGIRIYRK